MITLRRLFGTLVSIASLASCGVEVGSEEGVHLESVGASDEALQMSWTYFPGYSGMYTVPYVQNGTFPMVRMNYDCVSFNPCPAKARLGENLVLRVTNTIPCTLDGFTATAAGKSVGIVVRGVAFSNDGSKPTQVWKKTGDVAIKFPALSPFGDAPNVIVFQFQGIAIPTVSLGQGIVINGRMNCGSSLSGSTVTIGDQSGEMAGGYNFSAIPTNGVATLHINGGVYKVDGMVLVDGSPAPYSYSAVPLGPNGGYGTASNVYDFYVQTTVQ